MFPPYSIENQKKNSKLTIQYDTISCIQLQQATASHQYTVSPSRTLPLAQLTHYFEKLATNNC